MAEKTNSEKKQRWCREAESNHRHRDFQSPALPTELSRLKRLKVLLNHFLEMNSTNHLKLQSKSSPSIYF